MGAYADTGKPQAVRIRKDMWRTMGEIIATHQKSSFCLASGDFNFVEQHEDRYSLPKNALSGDTDAGEAKYFSTHFRQKGAHEIHQPFHTCQKIQSRKETTLSFLSSRLDRWYISGSASTPLTFKDTVWLEPIQDRLEKVRSIGKIISTLSDHTPTAFCRSPIDPAAFEERPEQPIRDWATKTKDFKNNVEC